MNCADIIVLEKHPGKSPELMFPVMMFLSLIVKMNPNKMMKYKTLTFIKLVLFTK